jgi:hypothetical protein
LNLLGHVLPIPDNEVDTARAVYLDRHPDSAEYLDFGDFSFYRMEIDDIYFVGGFGEMGWVTVSEYASI